MQYGSVFEMPPGDHQAAREFHSPRYSLSPAGAGLHCLRPCWPSLPLAFGSFTERVRTTAFGGFSAGVGRRPITRTAGNTSRTVSGVKPVGTDRIGRHPRRFFTVSTSAIGQRISRMAQTDNWQRPDGRRQLSQPQRISGAPCLSGSECPESGTPRCRPSNG